MKFSDVYSLVRNTFQKWKEDSASRMAAAMAFYTAIALAPMLVIVLLIVGLIWGEQAAQGELVSQIEQVTGDQAAEYIQSVIADSNRPAVGSVAGLISLVILVWGSTRLFNELQNALNVIWQVPAEKDRGLLNMIRDRALSFGMVLVIAFLLLVSLLLSAVISWIVRSFDDALPGSEWLWQGLDFVVAMAVVTLLFAAMFKLLPDAKVKWRNVWMGAGITAFLFAVGKLVLGIYLGRQSSSYGAASSLMVVLLWVYYTSQIVFFGAEFTQVFSSSNDSDREDRAAGDSDIYPGL